MKTQALTVKAAIQIQRAANMVFQAIVDPKQMSNYFISESSGVMEEGKNLIWKFPEFDEEAPIKVGKIEKNKSIEFSWVVNNHDHVVQILIEEKTDFSTVVRITETGGAFDENGIIWLTGNTEGWANFLACLKAWLEYGINLRKGAFDFMNG